VDIAEVAENKYLYTGKISYLYFWEWLFSTC